MKYVYATYRIAAGIAALVLAVGLVLVGPLAAALIVAMPSAGDKAAALGFLALYLATLRWLIREALALEAPDAPMRRAKLRTEVARAHELRSRARYRRRTRDEQEKAEQRAYWRGARDAAS